MTHDLHGFLSAFFGHAPASDGESRRVSGRRVVLEELSLHQRRDIGLAEGRPLRGRGREAEASDAATPFAGGRSPLRSGL
ncbi:hypothetical protein [Rhizobium halophytocola]|uniref:DUF1127 domain-containing protein n=1 Tax=Rhizobium halophytocola TaxID=735519 RepID=A0ABS4DSB4_9HYPH|nr:hypothetical protein [Rhizobium halophytocola]MBP1848588.1 hypothetical protein [Rhizobium halophytocola]